MASTIKCFKSVLGYKGNKCRGHKWISAIPKLRGLVKVRVKTQGKKGEKGVVRNCPRSAASRLKMQTSSQVEGDSPASRCGNAVVSPAWPAIGFSLK